MIIYNLIKVVGGIDVEKNYKRINYTNENFRKNIEYLISKNKITKSMLEIKLEMGEGSLSRYCKLDERAPEPKIGIINSLAKSFNVTIDDLINSNLQIKDQEILESNERKEVLFCKKLINQTNSNLCDWKQLNFYNDGFIQTEEDDWTGAIFQSNWIESNRKFKSKFINRLYDIDELSAFTFMLNRSVQVVIMKFIEIDYIDGEQSSPTITLRYELYLIKSDGRVLPSCSSHIYSDDFFSDEIIKDDVIYEVLEDLHRRAYDYFKFGKDNYEKELIYNDYLNDSYLDDDDLPF